MPRDNRKILRGIRVPVARPNAKPDKDGVIHKFASLTYTDGMEDELAAAFNQETLDKLLAIGSISGDWVSTRPLDEEKEVESEAEPEEAKAVPVTKPRSAGGRFSPAPPAP